MADGENKPAVAVGCLIAVIVPICLLSMVRTWCSETTAQYNAVQQRNAEEARTRSEEIGRREEAEAKAKLDSIAAKDAEERALDPVARLARVTAAFPDICEARRLYKLAPGDIKEPGLVKVKRAIDAEVRRQLSKGRRAFEATRKVSCADGWRGTSCLCDGPHQGCCSSHGGIDGCVPYPTDIDCPL